MAALFAGCAGLFGAEASAQQGVLLQKQVFTEKLDSLDLEKQLRKRKGLSIEELEKAADLVKDSIAEIKKQIVAGEGESLAEAKGAEFHNTQVSRAQPASLDFRRFLPKNVFDWIVVAVGGVAIISGIVLVAGLFGLLFRKKKNLQTPLHSIFSQTGAGDNPQIISKVPVPVTELKEEAIESIRRRMEESEQRGRTKAGEQDAGRSANVTTGDKKQVPFQAGAEDVRDTVEIKKRVILAARQGLDVQEISRRYHLSADQISLILRIARANDARNG
jgi:Mor family transcriptional regulator